LLICHYRRTEQSSAAALTENEETKALMPCSNTAIETQQILSKDITVDPTGIFGAGRVAICFMTQWLENPAPSTVLKAA
jgi:hypothetical protein